MNIFVLSKNVKKCASYHCDQHVVKMVLESAQMLSTVCNLSGRKTEYKPAFRNHPCTKWVHRSLSNWLWLRSLARELNNEFVNRYSHTDSHKSWTVISKLEEPKIDDVGLTPFVQAMPKKYRIEGDAVSAYRKYYLNEKRFAKWKLKNPYWWKHSRFN